MDGSIEKRIERLEDSTPDEPSPLTEFLMEIGGFTAKDFDDKPTMKGVLAKLREGYHGQREIDKGRQN